MNAFEQLQALAATAGPETKDVEIKLGESSQTLTIRRLTLLEDQNLSLEIFSTNEDGGLTQEKNLMPTRNAKLIAMSVVSDPPLTVDQVKGLPASIGNALLREINALNGNAAKKPVEAAAKNSLPTANSAA